MLTLLCFRILIWIAPLWRGRGSPVEYQKGYVLAYLLLWTVGLVRDTIAMAEGLLGLLTEFARRRIRTPRASRETLVSGSFPSY